WENPNKTEGYEGPLSKPQFRFFPSVFILFRPTAYSPQPMASLWDASDFISIFTINGFLLRNKKESRLDLRNFL
ncbi:MAG: hypothetical protein ABIH24_11005, partial [Verrucomicrobiota bacterium]